ncbi:hypothetical protein TgHK011_000924 [Trichoderma gracile]|nr:hypothetical protein TgHK011_000924 [Trichoderma gracile]
MPLPGLAPTPPSAVAAVLNAVQGCCVQATAPQHAGAGPARSCPAINLSLFDARLRPWGKKFESPAKIDSSEI